MWWVHHVLIRKSFPGLSHTVISHYSGTITAFSDVLHVAEARHPTDIYYYDPTPRFWASRRVSRGSGRAFLNKLLTSHLGRRSSPSRPRLPDRLPRRWPSTSSCAPRRLVLGRLGSGAVVRERGGARRRARSCSEVVLNPCDWWRPMLPACAPGSVGE